MATKKTYAIRLAIENGQKVTGEFTEIGARGARSLRKIAEAARPVSAELRVISRAARSVRSSVLGLSGAYLSLRGLKAIVDIHAEFETGLIGVGKTADLSGRELEALGVEIEALSKRIPVTTAELLAIAQSAGQLGVKGAANILKFTETVAKLGTATDLSGEAAAKTLARILNVTGEAADSVDVLGSVIVRLGNATAASESEIAAIATQVALATAVFKVSSAEATATAAAYAGLGIEAQIAGSATGKVFLALDDALRTGGPKLEALEKLTGKTGKELRQAFGESTVRVFQLFIESLGRVQAAGGSVAGELEKFELADQRLLKTIPALALRADILAESLRLANEETENTTALNIEAARQFESFTSQIKLVENSLRAIARAIGASWAPAMETVAGVLKGVTEDTGQVTDGLFAVALALGGIAAARFGGAAIRSLFTLRLSLIKAGGAATLAGGAMRFFGGTLAFLGGPWGLILGGLAAAMSLLGDETEESTETMAGYAKLTAAAARETERLNAAADAAGKSSEEATLRLRAQRLEEAVALAKDKAAALREFKGVLDLASPGPGDLFTSSEGITIPLFDLIDVDASGVEARIRQELDAALTSQGLLDAVNARLEAFREKTKAGGVEDDSVSKAVENKLRNLAIEAEMLRDVIQARRDFGAAAAENIIKIEAEAAAKRAGLKVGTAEFNQFVASTILIKEHKATLEGLTKAEKDHQKLEAKAAAIIKKNRTATEKYSAALTELEELRSSGVLADKDFWREQARLAEEWSKALEDAHRKALDASEEWSAGALRAFEDYARGAMNAAKAAEIGVQSVMGGLEDALVRSRSLLEIVKGIEEDLQRILVRRFITGPLGDALGDAFEDAFRFSGSSGVDASLSPQFQDVQVGHQGGIVGAPGLPTRAVPVSVFADAPRFHGGGLIGLKSDERPIIARRGEEILTASDPRHRGNVGSGITTLKIVNEGREPLQVSGVEEGGGGEFGGRELRVLLTPLVADVISRGGADTPLRTRFNVKPAPVRRG